jgi:hypothetical protein
MNGRRRRVMLEIHCLEIGRESWWRGMMGGSSMMLSPAGDEMLESLMVVKWGRLVISLLSVVKASSTLTLQQQPHSTSFYSL